MSETTTYKRLLFLLLLVSAALQALAGNTITVGSSLYHIDHQKNVILINQPTAAINAGGQDLKEHLVLDGQYSFVQPIYQVSTSQSYQVKRNDLLYTVYFTSLPVVHVDSRYTIVDSPSVLASFSMSEPSGVVTKSSVGIEIRGGFSQSFPKKSYELSFWADTTGATSKDVRLLNMRTDNKWNLQAMYNEALRFNNKVSFELWQEMHQLYYKNAEPDAKSGVAMTYVEVFVNNEYKGVYALSERIDRKQLKLKKYSNGSITGELYKGSDWGATTFTSLPPFDNTSEWWGGFEYKHPEERIDWTNLYDFGNFVQFSTVQDFNSHYAERFKLDNAVDYYIFLNLVRATDNTGKNIHIAKYKAGEPYFYVPWDLDGVLGTDWRGVRVDTTNDMLSNGFYDRLLQDCSPNGFRDKLHRRWAELRTTTITEGHIMAKFQANHDYLLSNSVYEREHLAWGSYSYDATQLPYMTTWLRKRLRHLDVVFGQSCLPLSTKPSQLAGAFKLYPNPANDVLSIESEMAAGEVSIQDMRGKTVLTAALQGKQSKLAIGHLAKGLYLVTVKGAQYLKTQKLVIN